METTLLMVVFAGLINGTAWALPSFYTRLPSFYFTGGGLLAAGLAAGGWLFYEGVPDNISVQFWFALFLNTAILAVAFTLAAAAPRVSDLTLVRPINALTPILMLLSGPALAFFGVPVEWETPNLLGIVGICLVVFGIYWLLSEQGGLDKPFRTFVSEKGVRMMFAAVVLYSVAAYYDLVALRAVGGGTSGSAFYLATVFPLIGVTCFALGALDRRYFSKKPGEYQGCWSVQSVLVCGLFGVLYATATGIHMVVADLTSHVTYVVAIKEGITAIDSAIVLLVVSVVSVALGRKVGKDRQRELQLLPRRTPAMLLIATGIFVVVVFGI